MGTGEQARRHAHAHGVAKLGVAWQKREVTIQLEAPMDSLVGFDRRPRTPAERALVDAVKARMQAPGELFRLDADAGCTLTGTRATSSLFEADGKPTGEHSDVEATFTYACQRPEKLSRLEVGLFSAYPKLTRISAEVAGPKGQLQRELRKSVATLPLVR